MHVMVSVPLKQEQIHQLINAMAWKDLQALTSPEDSLASTAKYRPHSAADIQPAGVHGRVWSSRAQHQRHVLIILGWPPIYV